MTYQGSKAKYNKYIVPILQKEINEKNIDTFIDCCCGGCNIIKDIKAKNRIGIDKNENWIAFLKTLSDGTYNIPEELPSMEDWEQCKYHNGEGFEKSYIGFVGVFTSYNSAGFYKSGHIHGATGEKQYRGRCNTLKKEIHKYPGIEFINADYSKLKEYSNCVIYIDPPYINGTHEYDVSKDFNWNDFWQTVREISQNNIVYVSEQEAPEDFEIVWELNKIGKSFGRETQILERLFKYKG